jgi:hypothetical protein
VLDGNFAVGCGHGADCPEIHLFCCMLERTDAITNEFLESITFVLAYPTVILDIDVSKKFICSRRFSFVLLASLCAL